LAFSTTAALLDGSEKGGAWPLYSQGRVLTNLRQDPNKLGWIRSGGYRRPAPFITGR
jgi:hypothetical protein